MTTNNEALQKIFEAALKQPDPPATVRPQIATPSVRMNREPIDASANNANPTRHISPAASSPAVTRTQAATPACESHVDEPKPKSPSSTSTPTTAKTVNYKIKQQLQMAAILIMILTILGCIGWLIASPGQTMTTASTTSELPSTTALDNPAAPLANELSDNETIPSDDESVATRARAMQTSFGNDIEK